MNADKEYRIINMRYEYPGFVGNCEWVIISDLSVKELADRLGEKLEKYRPFVLLTIEQGEVIREYERNENKHHMRVIRSTDTFSYYDGITEMYHEELVVDTMESIVEEKLERERINAALEVLTPIQKERVIKYFFMDMTQREIALAEGVDRRAVADSLTAALRKLRRILY